MRGRSGVGEVEAPYNRGMTAVVLILRIARKVGWGPECL